MTDPTDDSELQALRSRVLSDPAVSRYLADLNRKSVAVVLSGGGGKGAYEAGAVLALYDCGLVRFRALAGTSVGALNALLLHELCRTGERGLVLRTWCDLFPGKAVRLLKLGYRDTLDQISAEARRSAL
jgi:hypothetical protein